MQKKKKNAIIHVIILPVEIFLLHIEGTPWRCSVFLFSLAAGERTLITGFTLHVGRSPNSMEG